MRLTIHHIHHFDEETAEHLRCMTQTLLGIARKQETIMAKIQDLNDAIARNTSAEASVVTLLQGISQQLKDAQASGDPAALQAAIDQIDANTAAAAAAVVANTAQSA